ncbi:metallophosphatase domain-containing protein [Myxococcus faecalis]|uniref:metallophosphatase domain-containing protein n=1 Tax=Myxococcus faecalis TaxID=3115646 RepID=UPI003CEB675C
MKLVLISDTHRRHEELEVPVCDVLIHAGDFSRRGKQEELESFLGWFSRYPAREKVFIAGNHDFICERDPQLTRRLAHEAGVHYLDDEEVLVRGLRVWGSPVTPRFGGMAFNRERGADIRTHWDLIPEGLDVLVTHGPPKCLGDRTFLGAHVGCEDLLARVKQVRPRLHVYGHIHESPGEQSLPDVPTRFLNVSNCHLHPFGIRPPVEVELEALS